MLVIRVGIHKMLVRIANREDANQTTSGSALFSQQLINDISDTFTVYSNDKQEMSQSQSTDHPAVSEEQRAQSANESGRC